MDTDEKYLEADFYVRLAGEPDPDFIQEYKQRRVDDPETAVVGYEETELRDHHLLDEDVPIDGQICFYWPDRLETTEPAFAFDFPFRDHRKDDAPWAAFPGKEWGERHPVWKWQNPEAPREEITLKPSLGVGSPMTFHCWVRGGEVKWL